MCHTGWLPCSAPGARSQRRSDFFAASSISAAAAGASMGETLRVPAADAPHLLRTPPSADLATMAVALVAVSTSGPIMAATAAPALAIAFWRNAIAAGLVVPYAMARNRDELQSLGPVEAGTALVAGLLLAAHFATW